MTYRHLPAAVVFVFASSTGACFTYVTDAPGVRSAPDTDVRVEIEPTASDRIATALGPRVQTLDGHTVVADDTTISISVRTITRQLGSEERWNGDVVRIPRSAIARVEHRRFDAVKSTLIAGALVGAAIVAGHGGTSVPTTVIKGGTGGSGQ